MISVWFGVMFVRSGYYRDGIFRFNISLPKDFPNTTDVPVSMPVAQAYIYLTSSIDFDTMVNLNNIKCLFFSIRP